MFDVDRNRPLYGHMDNELLNHTDRIASLMLEGVRQKRKADQMFLGRTTQQQEEQEEDEKEMNDYYLLEYTKELASMQIKSPQERTQQRIAELKEELRRLTKIQEHEKQKEKETSKQQETPIPKSASDRQS